MFNHYARLKRLIKENPNFYIVKVNEPTKTKRFNGQYNYYDHYYRLYNSDTNEPIKYGKFQQLDSLANILDCDVEFLEDLIKKN